MKPDLERRQKGDTKLLFFHFTCRYVAMFMFITVYNVSSISRKVLPWHQQHFVRKQVSIQFIQRGLIN